VIKQEIMLSVRICFVLLPSFHPPRHTNPNKNK
jgi:hypothetical protein